MWARSVSRVNEVLFITKISSVFSGNKKPVHLVNQKNVHFLWPYDKRMLRSEANELSVFIWPVIKIFTLWINCIIFLQPMPRNILKLNSLLQQIVWSWKGVEIMKDHWCAYRMSITNDSRVTFCDAAFLHGDVINSERFSALLSLLFTSGKDTLLTLVILELNCLVSR